MVHTFQWCCFRNRCMRRGYRRNRFNPFYGRNLCGGLFGRGTPSCYGVDAFSSDKDCSHNGGICSSTTRCTDDGENERRSLREGVVLPYPTTINTPPVTTIVVVEILDFCIEECRDNTAGYTRPHANASICAITAAIGFGKFRDVC